MIHLFVFYLTIPFFTRKDKVYLRQVLTAIKLSLLLHHEEQKVIQIEMEIYYEL